MSGKLALFFTEGVSLKVWRDTGLIERDTLLYRRLAEQGWEISFVTYGAPDDAQSLPSDLPITILSKPSAKMDNAYYGRNILKFHGDALRRVDVIKSHQIDGSRYAAFASLRLRKPYIARCGYLVSVFLQQEHADNQRRFWNKLEEFFAFHSADAVCVPSQSEIDYLHSRYRIRRDKIFAYPNWIDTETFKPDSSVEKHPRRICFIGRFQPQKDPLLMIEAVRDMPDIELVMIGGGVMQPQIEAKIVEYGLNAKVYARLDNEELPHHLNASAMYVLPTRYEGGSPKTLLEAMACGLPVVSTSEFGVDQAFLGNGEHGYKCEAGDVQCFREAILKLLENPEQAAAMGQRGRQHMIDQFSIERAVERESALLTRLVKHT